MNTLILHPETEFAVSVEPSAVQTRDAAVSAARAIVIVDDEFAQELAVEAQRELKRILKDVEQCRTTVKAPVLDITRKIDTLAKDFVAVVKEQSDRVERLLSSYALKLIREAEAKERVRQAEIARVKREQETLAREAAEKAIISDAPVVIVPAANALDKQLSTLQMHPVSALIKSEGQTVTKVRRYEVSDIAALYSARPDLCEIVPRPSLINSAIKHCDSIPGLKIWDDVRTTVRV